MVRTVKGILERFLDRRGTQLAAMIAYYALLSFVPLLFLAIATLGLIEGDEQEQALAEELQEILPGAPLDKILASVDAVQENAGAFGLIGALVLLWSALGLFGALQTAFNTIFDAPHRSFVRGRGIAAAAATALLIVVVVGVLVVTLVAGLVTKVLPEVLSNNALSSITTFVVSVVVTSALIALAYAFLTNTSDIGLRDVLLGALLAGAAVQVTFQIVPLFIELTSGSLAVQMLGSTALLLIWFYVLGAILVFGHAVNWWFARGRSEDASEVEGVA